MQLRCFSLLVVLFLAVTSVTAAPIVFFAELDGLSEAPPNASPGTGFTVVTIDPAASTLNIYVTFADLSAPNTMAHIHVIDGPGDTTLGDTVGPVATTTPTFPGFPTGATGGVYNNLFSTLATGTYRAGWITSSGSLSQAEAELFEGIQEGRAYLNIHSSAFPAGEIRGFLVPAPEPSAVLLALSGLAGIVIVRRRSRSSRL